MIEVQREEVVTITTKLSGDRAKDLAEWLTWALQVWGKLKANPSIEREIFALIENQGPWPTGLVYSSELNYDTAILIRNKLSSKE